MAVPVARVHLAMAHAALPGLLPTPPATAVFPAACILPVSLAKSPSPSKAKPGRADAVDRWDADKIKTRPGSPSSWSSSSGSSSPRSRGSSPERASSCERWDSNKKCPASSAASLAPVSGKKPAAGSNSCKRPVISRSSSAERWDLHKKPREAHRDDGGDTGRVGGCSMDMESTGKPTYAALYAGPEPCVLPTPALAVRAM